MPLGIKFSTVAIARVQYRVGFKMLCIKFSYMKEIQHQLSYVVHIIVVVPSIKQLNFITTEAHQNLLKLATCLHCPTFVRNRQHLFNSYTKSKSLSTFQSNQFHCITCYIQPKTILAFFQNVSREEKKCIKKRCNAPSANTT